VSGAARIARVILDTRLPQLDRLFDYSIPEGMEIEPGVRVKVPLRSQARLAPGYVVEVATESEFGKLAPIAEVVSPVAVLTPELWSLASAVATRHAGNASDVVRFAIPGRYVRVEKAWLSRDKDADGELPLSDATGALSGYSDGVLESMLVPGARTLLQQPGGLVGGGDTERLATTIPIAHTAHYALSKGHSVVVVVPDWRDIESYRQSLVDVIPPEFLVVWDQNLTPAERYGEFLRTLEGSPRVVLGSRHAIYAPVHKLGLVIVVNDGDEAHTEPLSPYPHTRDIALIRQQHTQCAVIFASLVPSLNTLRWVDKGFLTAVSPSHQDRPTVHPTALSLGSDQRSAPGRLPSQAYQAAKEGLRKGPVLIQVFRAGFAPGLSCTECGEAARCDRCHGPLRQATKGHAPACAWCAKVAVAWVCPECSGKALKPRGSGVGRTVSDLGKAFPGVPVIRADGDKPLLRVGSEPALVVATRGAEPIAVGGYAAALLLDGASMLQRESLGTLEDTLRGWEHAISLVRLDGKVFVTEVEGSPALAVASGSYHSLLSHELTQREALRLPPAVRFVSISGPAQTISTIAKQVLAISADIDQLGPVPIEEGLVRSVIRFPYAQGSAVQSAVRSAYLKTVAGPRSQARDRVRIVFDNPRSLDVLTSE